MSKRIIICITGATGAIYGYRMLKALHGRKDIDTHLVVTKAAQLTIRYELGLSAEAVKKLAKHSYSEEELDAPIASGSFEIAGTIIAPCSMKTLASIAVGYDNTLVSRAASIALKERRRLILLVRETPLSSIHLRNMLAVSDAGGIIMPPLPPFYFNEKNIDKLVDLSVGKVLNMVGVKTNLHREWGNAESGEA